MSLEVSLQAAADAGQLLKSSHDNILALLAAGTNPVYRASIEELVGGGAWEELNDRFFQPLKFGTGGLRGRTIGRILTRAERGSAAQDAQPDHPCVGTNAMNFYNVGRATRGLVAYCKAWRAKANSGTAKPLRWPRKPARPSASLRARCSRGACCGPVETQGRSYSENIMLN